uniref:V-type proton ATPase subunit S1/VOA1 transmembrane domain-containing protein n=1 Tax=Triticum urartu TaxID=4572 RepID=A0A8R7QB34_TRIUA
MAAVWMALAVMLVAAAQVAVAAPVMAPAFLWAPKNYGLSPNEAKEVVHYQTISPKSLADSVLEEGGWSNLVCSKDGPQKNVDVAVLFLGSKLQSSDISKDKQVDPALADILKLSFSSSEFSMAFPYVAMSDDEALENSLLSGFTENCEDGSGGNHITYTDMCTASSESVKKHLNMDSVQASYLLHILISIFSVYHYLLTAYTFQDLVKSRMGNNQPTELIVFCSGGFKDNAKSEGQLLLDLVSVLDKSGAKYTVLYASQPYGLLENPSDLPLARYLAEKTNTTKPVLEKCDGECQLKSTLLEGVFVGVVLLIILISGLCCMMGIDTPSRFEAPQD